MEQIFSRVRVKHKIKFTILFKERYEESNLIFNFQIISSRNQ